ncbi:hypothetical protein RFI_26287 [Reticulomyxa filosa]|uniref:F-box domain-containing protein n=1 Tax=Reticulomyxa filosa TaxID=46433 RepID=X6MCB9_RETFI|nr:hypothetical protein RFI_26287 [Reticulomyxa filosa]|eukprot:ETO11087.1 hypothetical protein RFI_26287 [Reticulomyxa filosa]
MSAGGEKRHILPLTKYSENPNVNFIALILSTDDIIFQVAQWLYPAEVASCRVICKQWSETALDNGLWKWHCLQCFPNKVPRQTLNKSYNHSYFKYYVHNKKIRVQTKKLSYKKKKEMYYVEAEAALPSDENKNLRICPYTKIEYYRYLRFLPAKQETMRNQDNVMTNAQTNKQKQQKEEKKKALKKRITLNIRRAITTQMDLVRYALTKCDPTKFKDFECFFPLRVYRPLPSIVLAIVFYFIFSAVPEKQYDCRVYEGYYNVTKENLIRLSIETDYSINLQMKLRFDETEPGKSDRLHTDEFFGIVNNDDNDIGRINQPPRDETTFATINFPLRHEPYVFIPDKDLNHCMKYFDN